MSQGRVIEQGSTLAFFDVPNTDTAKAYLAGKPD
jgi:ABC-type phosphate transport system ATPase subunit